MKTSDDLPIYPIRTVASLSGVDARRLRSWEVEYQLLRPARTKGGHRLYSTRDLRMVQAIRRLVEEEGMSLQGVRAWLAAQPDQNEAEGAAPSRTRTPEPAGAGGTSPAGRRGE
ncbi:MAG TPA: MerR family transcriptional regulator [bacterium]|nr:MerR family transcriptional regulator [bacterium]